MKWLKVKRQRCGNGRLWKKILMKSTCGNARKEPNETAPARSSSSLPIAKSSWRGKDVLQYFLNPYVYTDTALQSWQVFKHEIRTQSGKHRHQGGVIIYVLEGKGYSIIDGERVDWKEGDLVLLPLKPEEVVHQHFNEDPDKPATWIAFYSIPIAEHIAAEMEQIENSPEFKG